MEMEIPWSNWFTKKRKRKPEQWMIANVSLEEKFAVEVFLRDIYDVLDPEDMPDFISTLAKDNLRLLKLVSQAGEHIEKTTNINKKKI
tara:strand:- start:1010 stop:1273 length:264 start_codon:yes stop_codon:yes gene_type:complete